MPYTLTVLGFAGGGVVIGRVADRYGISLTSLYVISAMFGLFQGGIVPSYAIIVREYFPSEQASTRVGLVAGGDGDSARHGAGRLDVGRDLRSYRLHQAAFLNGLAWNLLDVSIAIFLLLRSRGRTSSA